MFREPTKQLWMLAAEDLSRLLGTSRYGSKTCPEAPLIDIRQVAEVVGSFLVLLKHPFLKAAVSPVPTILKTNPLPAYYVQQKATPYRAK
jgi:hypothetical protein